MGEKRSTGKRRTGTTKASGQPAHAAGPKGGKPSQSTPAAGSQGKASPAGGAAKAAGPLSRAADREVMEALAQADISLHAQVRIYRALRSALEAYTREGASDLQRSVLQDAVQHRARILQDVVRVTLRRAHAEFARSRKAAQQRELEQALRAAQTVWTEIDPIAAQHASVADILGPSGEAMVRPFFARFLEGQNRRAANPGAKQAAAPKDNPGPEKGGAVTLKFPSDNEDSGGSEPVTLKFPSDNEDGGGDPAPVTLKYPSDEEDTGTCGPDGAVTLKYPSDEEDGGADNPGAVTEATTLKYPSDQEDGGASPDMTTCKYPSDDEDGTTPS